MKRIIAFCLSFLLCTIVMPISNASVSHKSTAAIRAAAIAKYENINNIPAAFINSDSSLQALMLKAIGPFNAHNGKYDTPMTLDDWVGSYWYGTYFQHHFWWNSLAEIVRTSQPCDYINMYNDAIQFLEGLSTSVGLNFANIGQPDTCGHIHAYNPAWGDDFSFSTPLNPGETLADTIVHGDIAFWINHEQSLLQMQFSQHPWLWIMRIDPLAFGSVTSSSIWNYSDFLADKYGLGINTSIADEKSFILRKELATR